MKYRIDAESGKGASQGGTDEQTPPRVFSGAAGACVRLIARYFKLFIIVLMVF